MVNLRSYIALGLILTGAAYSADFFSPFIGPTEYRGQLGFAYVEGENPITIITFQVDPRIAGSLLILEVPAGWSHTFTGGTLELSGGSLSPGESLVVPVSLSSYVEPDEYSISSTGVTSGGETVQAAGSLVVTMMVILRTLGAISSVKTTASLGTVGLVFVDIILKRFRGRVDSGEPSEGRLSPKSVLTREQLDALAEELDKGTVKLPPGEGGINLSGGVGLTAAGHLITGDEKHVVPIPDTGGKAPVEPKKGEGFSDAAGLEVETPDVDYREGSEASHPRKMSGIPKHGNVELKRGILGDADVTPKVEAEPEGEGILERIVDFFRNLF
ncbi:MAG: phage tail protein [Candidatus Bathyarchaeota archaeon]|nr:phage tail protein [Candidatus Bathyarchaeota archaeon]